MTRDEDSEGGLDGVMRDGPELWESFAKGVCVIGSKAGRVLLIG